MNKLNSKVNQLIRWDYPLQKGPLHEEKYKVLEVYWIFLHLYIGPLRGSRKDQDLYNMNDQQENPREYHQRRYDPRILIIQNRPTRYS